MFCSTSLFLTFFFLLIFFHFHYVFTANLYFGRLFLQRGAQCYKTIDFYQVPGLTFFMMPTPRRSECERGANFTFFKKVFLFFVFFFVLAFWVVQCSRFASNNSIWEPPGRMWGLREVFLLANPLFYLRNLFFFNHQFSYDNLILFGLGWPLGRRVGRGPPP